MCQQQACHLGEVYGRLKGSLLLSLSPWSSKQSPPGSHSEPRLTSRLHFQQAPPFITRQGCWRVGLGGYSGGPVTGQCVSLTPPLFFPTGCWEYRPLPQTAATLLSYTLYNGAPNLFRGGETSFLLLLPCSFTLVSCPLLFCSFLSVALLPYPFPLSLLSAFLVPLTFFSPLGHHSSYFVPPVLGLVSGLSW